jgi:hypothetical protein
MNWILAHYQDVINIAVSVIVSARLIVKLTPTPADDSVLEKVVNFLSHLGLKL